MYRTTMSDPDDEGPRGQVEQRRKPFVPDPDRVVYPVNPAVSERLALDKFQADARIVVGAQLSHRIVRASGKLEDEIRQEARDTAHYAVLEQVHLSFVGKAIKRRDSFMDAGDEPRWQR